MEKKKKVLLVNDSMTTLKLLEQMHSFGEYPMILDKVYNGQQAVKKIQEGKVYDCIFMNIEMPVMDGITAAQEIRKLGVKTPIIAWSAHSERDIGQSCREAGMNDYLAIPSWRMLELIFNMTKTHAKSPK